MPIPKFQAIGIISLETALITRLPDRQAGRQTDRGRGTLAGKQAGRERDCQAGRERD